MHFLSFDAAIVLARERQSDVRHDLDLIHASRRRRRRPVRPPLPPPGRDAA